MATGYGLRRGERLKTPRQHNASSSHVGRRRWSSPGPARPGALAPWRPGAPAHKAELLLLKRVRVIAPSTSSALYYYGYWYWYWYCSPGPRTARQPPEPPTAHSCPQPTAAQLSCQYDETIEREASFHSSLGYHHVTRGWGGWLRDPRGDH